MNTIDEDSAHILFVYKNTDFIGYYAPVENMDEELFDSLFNALIKEQLIKRISNGKKSHAITFKGLWVLFVYENIKK